MKNESRFTARRPLSAAASLALALLIGGCANLQQWGDPGSSSASAASVDARASAGGARRGGGDADVARRKLAEGVERYESGDYVGAIRSLNASELADADPSTRIEAEKYLAFSYCLTDRRTLCREAFDRALAMDPAFRLQPAEAGHPLWGPVYLQARKAAGKRAN